MRTRWGAFVCILAGSALLGLPMEARPASAGKPYAETYGRRGWHPFLHPALHNPTEQFAYAKDLQAAGKLSAAAKQYRALVVYWPQSAEAPDAQLAYAKILDRLNKPMEAFSAYQVLFDKYVGRFPYGEVLERQFQLGSNVLSLRRGHVLFFPGFAAPERAIPLLQQMVTNGLEAARAAEAQYLIGRAYELSLQPAEAMRAYELANDRYPDSPMAPKAEFARIRCLYASTEDHPYDRIGLDDAWAALTVFLNEHSNAEDAPQARLYRDELFQRRAFSAYNEAQYYDRIVRRPQAALIGYRDYVKLFPNTEWVPAAQSRIEVLARQLGGKK